MGAPSTPVEERLTPTDLYEKVNADRNYYDKPENNFYKDVENAFEFKHFDAKVKNRIHSLAYEYGHSAGYHDIITQYFDLVDLARLCLQTRF